jgi:hypothetical protein
MASAAILSTLVLALTGCGCIARAAALLSGWRPARGRIVYNGYDRMQRQRDGAWTRHGAPAGDGPLLDRVVFEDDEGREVRADLRRWSGPYANHVFLWYDPVRPERVTHRGPAHWCAAALVCVGTAAWIASHG